jgi:hypothetical protein
MIISPNEGWVDHDTARKYPRTVAGVHELLGVLSHGTAGEPTVPAQRTVDGVRIGVEEQLVGIEELPFFRLMGAVYAIGVTLARAKIGEVAMPDTVRSMRQF